ncbi:MAG TPA: lipoprotein [Gammaproteobacteria bacterium]
MNHTLYKSAVLVALLALGVTACGQKGPLVMPPAPVVTDDAPPETGDPAPQNNEIEDTDEQY